MSSSIFLGLALLFGLVVSAIVIVIILILTLSLLGLIIYYKVNPTENNYYINNEAYDTSELENILSQELQEHELEDDGVDEDEDGNHPFYNDHINPNDN